MRALPPWTGRCISLDVTRDHAEVAMLYNGKRFHILLKTANLHDPENPDSMLVEHEYLQLLQTYLSENLENPAAPQNPDAARNLFVWIAEQCSPLVRDLAPRLSPKPQYMTLDDYLNPPTCSLAPKLANGTLFAPHYAALAPPALLRMTTRVPLPWCLFSSPLPAIDPARIEVAWHPSTHGLPTSQEVTLDGNRPYYLKLASGDAAGLEREAAVLLRLQETGVADTVRVPRLHGYVQLAGDPGGVSALLLTRVETLERLARLRVENVPRAIRQRWFDDVEAMVRVFHAAGVVWGDAGPENVLVDAEDEVWVVDFAGLRSRCWMVEEGMDGVEWDLRGLAGLREFLRLGKGGEMDGEVGSGMEVVPLSPVSSR